MYNLAIGDRTYSSWSLRGWLMFAKFDILVNVDTARMKTPEFSEMLQAYGNGRQVPALRIEGAHDTIFVADTLAIAETLHERHPEKSMWPKDPVARGFARTIVAEMHAGFTTLRNDCAMNLRHCYNGFSPSDALRVELSRLDTIWQAARAYPNPDGPWLFGEYSLADAFYAPVATRIATYGLPVGDVAAAYVKTTLNDPVFKAWRAAGLAENYVQPGYDLDLQTVVWPV
ncbi:MAG: glutathione S-transferase [Paracoccaceae bacterium]